MNTIYTLMDDSRDAFRAELNGQSLLKENLVVFLCAQWCRTCDGFQDSVIVLCDTFPQVHFLWLDIEDDAEVLGDVDIESFPTIAIFREGVPVHFGVSLPQMGVVKRLISALMGGTISEISTPVEIQELPRYLDHWLAQS